MRLLFLVGLTVGCGTEEVLPDASFAVTITNKDEDCADLASDMESASWPGVETRADVCNCVDSGGEDCSEDARQSSESLSYDFFLEGNTVAIEVDGQPFASGAFLGCALSYESPVWLEIVDGARVNWQVRSVDVRADTSGACSEDFPGAYHFLGIEEVVIVESDSLDYPVGRTVRKVIHGQRRTIEE